MGYQLIVRLEKDIVNMYNNKRIDIDKKVKLKNEFESE